MQTFAGYRIVRLLGSGAMGEVYLAEHPRLPRRDALKVLPADVSADPDYRARFEREADLASTLWHPHIVSVHDRGEYKGQLWISMDYVDGQDAGRLLADRYPAGMPADQVVQIVTAVASAPLSSHAASPLSFTSTSCHRWPASMRHIATAMSTATRPMTRPAPLSMA